MDEMETLNILQRIAFDENKPAFQTLLPGPGPRVMLLCLRAGQTLAEHSASFPITVQALSGRALFYDAHVPFEMTAGALLRLEASRPHKVEAQEDTVLLVTMLAAPA